MQQYDIETLYNLAYKDRVTNYYNWNWMDEKLTDYRDEGIESYGFVHFDLKDFKMINEIYGHVVGNHVLTRISEKLQEQSWIYFGARCDNDNFAMMTKEMEKEEFLLKLQTLFAEITEMDIIPGYKIYYRCGAVLAKDATGIGSMAADPAKLAQSQGKKPNGTEIFFYTDEMKEREIRGKKLKNELPDAIKNGELLVYLQPKYDANSETLIGAEALVRWFYKHEQLMAPGMFIPYLERDGAIEKIDQFVLDRVCYKLDLWKKAGKKLYPVSVNLSRLHLNNPDLVEILCGIVDKYDISHELIEFELTESAAYDNKEYLLTVMHQLRGHGFKLSMDDFGTGYSSLSLLKDMPLNVLKIDKSFVDDIDTYSEEHKERLIIKDIIGMTKHMNVDSLAEGVETFEQKELLKEWGCQFIQGYYYSKPIPMDEYELLLG